MSTIWLETCRGIWKDIIKKCIRLETRNQILLKCTVNNTQKNSCDVFATPKSESATSCCTDISLRRTGNRGDWIFLRWRLIFADPWYATCQLGVASRFLENIYEILCFLLGNSPASESYTPTFRNTLFHLHRQVGVEWLVWEKMGYL